MLAQVLLHNVGLERQAFSLYYLSYPRHNSLSLREDQPQRYGKKLLSLSGGRLGVTFPQSGQDCLTYSFEYHF